MSSEFKKNCPFFLNVSYKSNDVDSDLKRPALNIEDFAMMYHPKLAFGIFELANNRRFVNNVYG